jgi:predicted flap endonuclease-1-like 5' DNA nuclease
MGSTSRARKRWRSASLIAILTATAASAQTTQSPQTGTQTEKPQAPETAPARPPATPLPAVAQIGPAREIKLAEYTWFRFGAQIQAWFQARQDRIRQPDGSDPSYAFDFLCRRCRFFTTGSIVKDVYFNVLFEAANTGRADATGAKGATVPSILDAYGQVKFADAFWLSAGQILLPLTRNGLQPTTTYVSLDTANTSVTPAGQGNTFTLRDLGVQANGFFAGNHVEYRLGVYQGTRQAAIATQTASHNGPRVVGMLSLNFWDPETGYVNGGHYFGTRRVVGVMGNFDYQALRKNAPATTPFPVTAGAGADKNAYYGVSAAAFINYPLAGVPNPRGGDELVGLLQFGYYDGGLRGASVTAPTNFGSYPLILKQTDYLAEAGYYNHAGRFSIFGKYERRKVSDDYPQALRLGISPSTTWIAGGVKYYVAPSNFLNLTLQYERINTSDALATDPGGTNNFTLQVQTILY